MAAKSFTPIFFPAPSTLERQRAELEASLCTEETVFPKVSRESHHLLYRLRCPSSGAFRCASTGLVFVVTEEAEFRYKIAQWDEALLRSSGRTPAGPLYDIESPDRVLCELRLPHCELETADLSQGRLAAAHISGGDLSLIEPQGISRSHVAIPVSGLSLFGLLRKWISKFWPVSGKVLLFRSPRGQNRKIKVNVHLLLSNIPVLEVEKLQGQAERVCAPPQCKLVIDQHYSVACPDAEIVQPERAEFRMDNDPDYSHLFELCLPPESSTVSITVSEEGRAQKREVWTYKLDLTASWCSGDDPRPAPHTDPQMLLRSVRTRFIDGVSDAVLSQLLDRLLQGRMLTPEEAESANGKSRADKARYVVDAVLRKGSQVSLVLIRNYCKLDPYSDLCDQLTD